MHLSKAAQQEIVALGSQITPQALIQWAQKHKRSALYKSFEWDDSIAAAQYRIVQARAFMRLVVTVVDQSPHTVRAFVSLQGDRGSVGYRSTAEVMGDDNLRAQMIDQFLDDMRRSEIRYRKIEELAKVFEAIDEVRKSRKKPPREGRAAA
jgi:hypothetical protein